MIRQLAERIMNHGHDRQEKEGWLKSRCRGFSLIELIIVIAVIGILIALSLYGLSNSRRKSTTVRAKSDMVSLGHSVMGYHDLNKDNSDLNAQWPRDMYNTANGIMDNKAPWELIEGSFWSKSESIKSKLAYERFGCSPEYGQNFDEGTQETGTGLPVMYTSITTNITQSSRQNACVVSSEVTYVGINWAGIDKDFGLADASKVIDNGFLLLYTATPKPDLENNKLDGQAFPKDKEVDNSTNPYNIKYKGKFLLKMGGSDEVCDDTNCKF